MPSFLCADRPHRLRRLALIGIATLLCAASPVPPVAAPSFAPWIDGTAPDEPDMQVQAIDGDTYVLRQSVRTNFEAPFLYLIFGSKRALLIDTGAGGLQIRPTIERVIADWRARHGGRAIELVVAHSHGHGDHHAGDAEFAGRPNTHVVGLSAADVAHFFGVDPWPEDIAPFDLGGRTLQILATPGHEDAHIMVYDPVTQLLFSGDMLYPGRLYVPRDKFADFRASAERLAAFAHTHPIRALLGAHIEMTRTAGKDYPMRAARHPVEHGLALAPSVIDELAKALETAPTPPVIDRHADFIVYPLEPRPKAP